MKNTRIAFVYTGILLSFAAVLFLASKVLVLSGTDSYDQKGEAVSVRLDLKELDSFTEEDIRSFREYLMRDARWRVFEQKRTLHPPSKESITTATLRNNRYGIWLENENILYANGDNPDELKIQIHFGLNSIRERYTHSLPSELVITTTSSESVTLIPYRKSYHRADGRFVSELAIEGEGLVIHISETSRPGDEKLTYHFLDYLRSITASLKEKGITDTELSVDSLNDSSAPECVFVSTSRASHAVAVRGWLNPAEPGTISLEARGIMTDKKAEYWGSPEEVIGWSEDPAERFYFAFWQQGNSRLQPERYRYVIRFVPASGGEEREIAECVPGNTESYTYQSVLAGGVSQ